MFWKQAEMDDEHLQLAKRHSFPYMQVYTWNILKSGSQNEVEIQIPQEDSTPVINSDGTSEEREARLEAAILWIRKELVSTYSIQLDTRPMKRYTLHRLTFLRDLAVVSEFNNQEFEQKQFGTEENKLFNGKSRSRSIRNLCTCRGVVYVTCGLDYNDSRSLHPQHTSDMHELPLHVQANWP